MLLVAPLTILPLETADLLWTFLLINALVLTLFALRVRDRRIFVLVPLWPPVLAAFQTGNITLVLVLLVALAWRYRDRDFSPGALVGAAIALKLFLWPVAVWLVATRRYREAAIAAILGVLSLLTVLPFMSLGDYAQLVRNNDDLLASESYSAYALLHELGASDGVARTVWLAAGIAVLVLGRRSFPLCIVASLMLSPIVWLHYFALLIVPLAVVRARLWVWALPLAYWLTPGDGNGSTWQLALALAVTAAILAVLAVNLLPTRHARA